MSVNQILAIQTILEKQNEINKNNNMIFKEMNNQIDELRKRVTDLENEVIELKLAAHDIVLNEEKYL